MKEVVQLFFPDAKCRSSFTVQSGTLWVVEADGRRIGKGWRAASAWNNAHGRIRATFKTPSEFVWAMGDLQEGKRQPEDYAEQLKGIDL